MSLITHAKKEMDRMWPESDDMQDMVKANVLELLEVFSKQGHSGSSAPYVLGLFQQLADFKPLGQLTGEDDEWMEVGPNTYQNIRCCSVFKKGKNGTAYWLDGNIFRDQNGCTFTNGYSRVKVEFPWTMPESKVIDVFVQE